jgi:hypothetical protein
MPEFFINNIWSSILCFSLTCLCVHVRPVDKFYVICRAGNVFTCRYFAAVWKEICIEEKYLILRVVLTFLMLLIFYVPGKFKLKKI